MVKNIYGQAIRDMEKMRVEEKIDHIKNAIPDDLYKVLTEEWHRFVKSSVNKGQGERELVEFDYFFELFMKFPHRRGMHSWRCLNAFLAIILQRIKSPWIEGSRGFF